MNKNSVIEQLKKLSPHIIVILLFIVISFTYFSPVLKGKMLDMPDIRHHKGMSKEVVDFRQKTGEEALWTNSMFSGMPAYQISTKYKANLIQYIDKGLMMGIPRPANMLFLYLLGFYILLLSLSFFSVYFDTAVSKINEKLSIIICKLMDKKHILI